MSAKMSPGKSLFRKKNVLKLAPVYPLPASCSVSNLSEFLADGNASFLRAARSGNLEKVIEILKGSIDINTSNANGLNALHLAAKEGHVNVVTELVKRSANVNAATKKGNTALHIASLAGQEEVVKVLIQLGANVNIQSQNGFTPLYMAAQENHDAVVSFLLANGANQSLATEDGFTPLAVALQQGHDKVVAVLLENDTKGKVRLPALHIAAKKDDCKAATLLLQSDHNPDVTSKSGFTPLHIAAHYGNENIAKILLSKGADVNYAAKHQITPLHVASKWGKTNMVELLLEKGANIEAATRDGLTPLHCAARSGHDRVVDLLLEKGAPFLAKTKNGLAPLHMASQGDHVDSARILLYHKAPVDDVTVDYLTALHVAAHCGHVKVAKLLLDRKADPNARALNGFTPLHIACKKNRIKVVELLLKHGASIEATTESGLTPLHVASFMGCMNIVIYLIQNGANPDVPTVRGETPLHLAARANQTDIIRILLRNGASVDARAREEQTPLHIAARLGNVDIVSLLLQHGAAVDAVTKDLYTPLHITAKEDQEEVAAALLDHGASLTATTKKGFTPLHLAAKYGNIKVARLLLQKGAPVDAQGKNGVTPLHVAAHYNHVNVALLLLDKGASPHAMAKNGYTPLHIVAKKNQMDIASSLLEYGANTNAESKAGFTPLHLTSQEGHSDMAALLIDNKANVNQKANNGLTHLHLCAQEDKVNVAQVLVKNGAEICPQTKAGYTPLHVASHFGQVNMIRFLLQNEANVHTVTSHGYTPLHQAAQQGHTLVVNLLLENQASPNVITTHGQTPLSIAQRLGYISVVETLKVVTETTVTTTTTTVTEEKYKVVAPETMQETFMTDSEDEGGADFDEAAIFGKPTHATHVYLPYVEGQNFYMSEEAMLGDQSYRYLTADEMKSLGDDSLPIDVTKDEKQHDVMQVVKQFGAPMVEEDNLSPQHITPVESGFSEKFSPDNVDLAKAPVHAGRYCVDDAFFYLPPKGMSRSSSRLKWKTFLVSFMVDARGGAMRGCRHSGVRVIIPPRKASMPMRITCRYLRKEKLIHPPPLMEGEACASRILEMGPVGARFLGPVIIEVPHFASTRGKEREITILRSDTGESWREHTLEASEEAVQEVLNESFEGEELSALEDLNTNRITRILTTDFPQYFAIVTRIRQEVHGVGPEGGMVSSTVVPQVQAIFPEGALTKKIRVGLQAQPIAPELVAKLLGNRVAVSPIVTVEPRRRKFHKPITLTIPVPQAATKGMINQYSGDAPTLRLLCSITGSTKSGGSSKAQWEDVTGSTPLTFVNDCVSFTTTVSARFWLMDCRQVNEVTRFATELYQEAVYVPFMSKFVIFAKRHDPLEAQLRVFCMTDDKEDKTLESQEHFIEVAKSRDVEVLEGKMLYLEFAGNLIPVTKSGDQLKFDFQAFHENRLPFNIRVKDPHMESMGRIAFMKEPKASRSEPPQTPICNLNVALPDAAVTDSNADVLELVTLEKRYDFIQEAGLSKPELIHRADLRLSDIARELDKDWVLLAQQLDVSEQDTEQIKAQTVCDPSEQARMMLRIWLQKSGPKATGNELEKGLRKINREDIIKNCMFNVELVTDDVEKAVAKVHLDQSGFDVFKEELGSSREASMRRGASLDVSYDEQDIMKEAESAAETSSETGSIFERDQLSHALSEEKDKNASLSVHETLLSVTDSSFNCNTPTSGYLNSNETCDNFPEFKKCTIVKSEFDNELDYGNKKNQDFVSDHAVLLVAHSGKKMHNFWPSDEIIQEPANVSLNDSELPLTSLQSEIVQNNLNKTHDTFESNQNNLNLTGSSLANNILSNKEMCQNEDPSKFPDVSKQSVDLPNIFDGDKKISQVEYVAVLEPVKPHINSMSSNFIHNNKIPSESMVTEDILPANKASKSDISTPVGTESAQAANISSIWESDLNDNCSHSQMTGISKIRLIEEKKFNTENESQFCLKPEASTDASDLGYFSLDKESHLSEIPESNSSDLNLISKNLNRSTLKEKKTEDMLPDITQKVNITSFNDSVTKDVIVNHVMYDSKLDGSSKSLGNASETVFPILEQHLLTEEIYINGNAVKTGITPENQFLYTTKFESTGDVKINHSEDSKMRRPSKTPPPTPVEEIDQGVTGKLSEESLAAALLPEVKIKETKKSIETEVKSIEATVGDSVMPSAPQEIPAKLTESETWPSGDLDTSQVSVSSLPDDEKSEATATVSSTAAVTIDSSKKNAEITEVDNSGMTTHIIQKTTHMTLITEKELEDSPEEDSASMPVPDSKATTDDVRETVQIGHQSDVNKLPSQSLDNLKDSVPAEHAQPLHSETSMKESTASKDSAQPSIDESAKQAQSGIDNTVITPCAFVNTAFAGAEVIDEVEQAATTARARSPYEVIRGEEGDISDHSLDDNKDSFHSERADYVTRRIEIRRRPLLQHIPSEISEEDLVEREITSPISKEEFDSFVLPEKSFTTTTSETVTESVGPVDSSDTEIIQTVTRKIITTVRYGSSSSDAGIQDVIEDYETTSDIKLKSDASEPVLKTDDVTTPDTDTGVPSSPFELASETELSDADHRTSTGALSQSLIKNEKDEKSRDSLITTTQSQSFSEQPASVTLAESSKDTSDSFTLHELSEAKDRTASNVHPVETDMPDKLLSNGPGEVEYIAEYDYDEDGEQTKKYDQKYYVDDIVIQERPASETQEMKDSKACQHYSSVSDDVLDSELRDILESDQQLEDIFERPVTPEPPKDDLSIGAVDFSQNLNRLSSGAIEDLTSVEDFAYSNDIVESPTSPDSKSGFAYGMHFEKYGVDQSEEAMDVDSDQYSEEKEPSYGYGMRFERDPDLEEDIPCYGDLYTHEEEDEDALENGEKAKILGPKPVKDSEFDILAGRKYFTKNVEIDELSMSSLQEFENLEAEIVSGRKSSVGSIDSLNGKQAASKSGEHDDVSMSSLTEFERLERECTEGEKIDPSMQESITQLSEIEEGHESQASEASQENKSDAGKEEDESIVEEYNDQLDNIEEIILKTDAKESDELPFQFIIKQPQKTDQTDDEVHSKQEREMVSKIPKLKTVKTTVVTELGKISSWTGHRTSFDKSLEASDSKDELDQDSLRDETSLKPDSLIDDARLDFQDSLHEERLDETDSLQGDNIDEMRDSLFEERQIEDDSLHEMDILPDESSLSLECSVPAAASLESSRADEIVDTKAVTQKESKDTEQDIGSFTSLHLEARTQINISDIPRCDMQSSTDSLEQSSSAALAAFHIESESLMSSSLNSAITSEDYTMVSSTDTLEQEGRILYRYEDIPVDDIEMLVRSGHRVIMDSEGNIEAHDHAKYTETDDVANTALCLSSKNTTEVKLPPSIYQVHSAMTTVKYVNGDRKESSFHSTADQEANGKSYESSHYDPDVEVEEIETTDELGNKKIIRKIKKVIHSKSQFSSSSSPKDVEEKMKEFLREHTVGDGGTAEEEVEEERSTDEKGNVVIMRTIKRQVITDPEVHSKTFTGPDADRLSKDFVETYKSMDPTENIHEYEKVDEQGNVVRVTEQFVVEPRMHSVSFSGPDAHKQMEEYMKQWNLQSQNLGEFQGDEQIATLQPSKSHEQSQVSVPSDSSEILVQKVFGDTIITETVSSIESSEKKMPQSSTSSISLETESEKPKD